MRAIENHYTEFILDSLREPQPVQVGEQRRDVVMTLCPDYETCGGINDRLQSVQLAAWQSGEGDVAVIQFGHDQTEDECQHGLPWQWAVNAADLPQNAEARADESRDVWPHRQVTIQVDTEVTDRGKVIRWKLVTTAWWNKPHKFNFWRRLAGDDSCPSSRRPVQCNCQAQDSAWHDIQKILIYHHHHYL